MLKKGQKAAIAGVTAGVLGVGAILFGLNISSEASTEMVYKDTTVTRGNLVVGITESGNTVLGTQTVDYTITQEDSTSSGSSTGQTTGMSGGATTTATTTSTMPSLVVEELYVSASETIQEGAELLKVTDASYSAVKSYLEQAVTTAEFALQQAQIDRTLTKTTAESDYSSNKAQAELAQEAYNNTIKKLANSVTNASNELSDTKSSISTLSNNISNDTYYSDYNISALKKAVTSAQKAVDELDTKIRKLEAKEQTEENQVKLEQYKQELSGLEQTLSQATQSYEQAYSQYTSALSQAKSELSKLQNQLTSLQLSYDEAVTNQKKGKLEAQATLDAALVTGNNATTLYNIALDGIDDEVSSATESLEDARDQLAAFNALVVDGKIVANCTGMVTALGYTVGDSISEGTPIATVADAAEVTITVSVDQEDIASIAVNDQVNIAFSAYTGITYTGIVSSISTTASSDSSSTVTYPVVVTLSGDVSAIYSGMSADVTFITKQIEDVLYVSNKTIISEGTKSYVKVKAADETITTVEVETGFSDGNNVEIISGLSEGETVLIESQVNTN